MTTNRTPSGVPAGGEFAAHTRDDTPITLGAPALSKITVSSVTRGDSISMEIAPGEYARLGVVRSVSDAFNDKVRIHFHDGSWSVLESDGDVLTEADRVIPYLKDAGYDERLAAAYSSNATAAILGDVLFSEAEDDFMHAVTSNPNSTPEQIEQAARHNSQWVREAAIENPNTGLQTLIRLRDEADEEAIAQRVDLAMAGRNSQSSHTEWQIATQEKLVAAAAKRIKTLSI
jgi:hypothetical protein